MACFVVAAVAIIIICFLLWTWNSEGLANPKNPKAVHYKATALQMLEDRFKAGTDTFKMARMADPDIDAAEYFDVRNKCRNNGCTVREIMDLVD